MSPHDRVEHARPTDVPEIVLEGSPRNRGRIHGETLRPEICRAVDLWKEALATDIGGPVNDYIESLVGETAFLPAIETTTPNLLEEVRGLAEGSGIEFATMYAFQLVDEDWWFRRNRRFGIGQPFGVKCSTVAIRGRGIEPPVVAQNLDIPKWSDGLQMILRVRRLNGSEDFVFTYAGMIGLTGISSSGIGVCVNSLIQLDTRINGLPVAFVVRELLSRGSLEDAIGFISGVQHASGQNYVIGAPDGIAAFECSADRAVRYGRGSDDASFAHTNHPLVNSETRTFQEIRKVEEPEKLERSRVNSERRLACLNNTLMSTDTAEGPVDLIKRALRSHDDETYPICCHSTGGRSWFTAWSVIYEFSDPPVAHVTCGPPCLTEFRQWKVREETT